MNCKRQGYPWWDELTSCVCCVSHDQGRGDYELMDLLTCVAIMDPSFYKGKNHAKRRYTKSLKIIENLEKSRTAKKNQENLFHNSIIP